MHTQDHRVTRKPTRLVRTSVLVRPETDAALRELAAEGERPLSYEIRRALERHVEQAKSEAA